MHKSKREEAVIDKAKWDKIHDTHMRSVCFEWGIPTVNSDGRRTLKADLLVRVQDTLADMDDGGREALDAAIFAMPE